MQIVHSLAAPISSGPTIVTIGKFDGVHLGHQQLIRAAVAQAQAHQMHSVVLTFDPHPRLVLQPDSDLRLLTTISERARLVAALMADYLVVAPFTQATMQTPADTYMQQLCDALRLRALWVGQDFALGRKREGTVPRLREIGQQRGFTVHTLPPVRLGGEPVSASRVRRVLATGDVAAAAHLLGRPFWLQGPVVQGDQRGRTIGFPTANIAVDALHALPANGVYACQVWLSDDDHAQWPAVTNVGLRPTFDGTRRTIEVHLLDWQGALYGRTLRLAFLARLRGEHKFNSADELIAQIGRDVQQARTLLAPAAHIAPECGTPAAQD